MTGGTAAPRAVVLLPNSIDIDARAQRNALTLASAGFDVTMLGWGDAGPRAGALVGLPFIRKGAKASGSARPSFGYRVVRKLSRMAGRSTPPQLVVRGVAFVDKLPGRLRRLAVRAVRRGRPEQPETQPGTWQRLLPHVVTMERILGPELAALDPDLVVCDVHLLGLATDYARERTARGLPTSVVYDAREYVYGLASDDEAIVTGFPLLEAEHIGAADAVVTVCEPIADFLAERYDLPVTPPLVQNAPIADLPPAPTQSVRAAAGVADDVPLLVYAGGLSRHRGVHHVLEALPALPGVHFAIGARAPSSYTRELEALATRLGVADRVHWVPYAPTHEVADYLSSATAAVIPFLPVGNHTWAAPNKFFEAVQARLPIITSDMEWLSGRVRRLGIGEVFAHGDAAGLAEAARGVLDHLDRYRAAYTDELVREHTWEAVSPRFLDACLQSLDAGVRARLVPDHGEAERLADLRRDMLHQRALLADSDLFGRRPRLRIGTSNSAGLPRLWGDALMVRHPEAVVETAWVSRNAAVTFGVDDVIAPASWIDPTWQKKLRDRVAARVTHVLSESGRSTLGRLYGEQFHDELGFFADSGVVLGLVFHGSDIRNPARHAELEPASPFADPKDPLTRTLQAQVDALTPHVLAFDGPVFVTTHDLLDHLPGATWLPLTIDVSLWQPGEPPLSRPGPPVVFHSPTNSRLKGTDAVDALCAQLAADGRIVYDRGEGLTGPQMRERLRHADIVIDQLAIGDYGMTAVEAMASGRVVITHIADRVLDRLPERPPVLLATRETVADRLREILDDAEATADIGRRASDYARRWHNGAASTRVLAQFMGLEADR